LIHAAVVPYVVATPAHVVGPLAATFLVHPCGSVGASVGTQMDRVVPCQMSVQVTNVFAFATDPASSAKLASIDAQVSPGFEVT